MESVSVKVDEKVIRSVIEAEIQAAIVRQFEKIDDLLPTLVGSVLHQKVDRDGKPSSYSDAKPFIEVTFEKAIREATRNALLQYIQNNEKSIMKELEKQLSASKGDFAKQMIAAVLETTKNQWRFSVNINTKE